MTTRYALIETRSGYVWGVTDAADPVAACRAVEEGIGVYGRSYGEGTESDLRNGAAGFLVYEAPAGFAESDALADCGGDDPDFIAAVSALPRAAFVMTSDA